MKIIAFARRYFALWSTVFGLSLAFIFSCKAIHYDKGTAAIYYEFGDRSHYYANSFDHFGIELVHGFKFYNHDETINKRLLPTAVRKRLLDRRWKTVFILQNYLSPYLTVLQKCADCSNCQQSTNLFKNDRPPRLAQIDTLRQELRYTRLSTNGDTIFCIEKLFVKASNIYKLSSYSFANNWMKSKLDSPSFNLCEESLAEILSGWKEEEYISQASVSDVPLLQTASQIFWKSKNNYLLPLEIISRNPAAIKRDPNFYEASTTFNSFAGNYKEALIQRDTISDTLKRGLPVPNDVHLTDASRIIYDSARTNSIVIINEAHTQPRNRRVLSDLLDSMYAIGYTDLFVETLEHDDTDINKRKFPVQVSGYYSSEPNFGNALRKALRVGYLLHPYDNDTAGDLREIQQATVIADFLKSHKNAKVLVYCGHGHVNERPKDSMMAYFLKVFTGIDPFTIEQTKMIEKGSTSYELPLYKTLITAYPGNKPQTFIRNQQLWIPADYRGQYDMLLSQPPTVYNSNGVAEWAMHYGDKKLELDLNSSKYDHCIFQIFDASELKSFPYWELIPISNLVLKVHNHLVYYLSKGSYCIYVTNLKRKIIFERRVSL